MEHFGDCFAHDSMADDCREMAGKVAVLVTSLLSVPSQIAWLLTTVT